MKVSKQGCDLATCMMCRSGLKEWLPAIEAHRIMYRIKKGERIFSEGENMTGIFFVYQGVVKVHKHWGPEKELIVRFAKNGDIVGHRGLGNDTVYPVSATALSESEVCFIPLEFFLPTLKVNHEFLYQLMFFFAEELKISERKMRNLAHMPVKGRVAQCLISLKQKFGLTGDGYINITLSKQDLASFAGATYETVFRMLGELEEEGVIRTDNRNICITDEIKLSELMNISG